MLHLASRDVLYLAGQGQRSRPRYSGRRAGDVDCSSANITGVTGASVGGGRRSSPEVQAIPEANADPRVRSEPGLRVDKPREVMHPEGPEIAPYGGSEGGEVVVPFAGRRVATPPRLRLRVARADMGIGTAPRDVASEPGGGPQAPHGELERRGDVGQE